jgi:iron complex transport system substrate-binding protein
LEAHYTRRSLVGSSLGIGVAVLAPTLAAARQGTPDAAGEASGWSMTDGRGTTIELPAVPVNIIAQTISGASLWDFGIKVKGIYGDALREDGTPDPQTGDMNLDEVEVLGTWASGIDLEAVIAVDADLFVDVGRSEDGALWSIAPDVEAALLEICPTFSIKVWAASTIDSIARFEELAASLGANLESPEILAAREAFAANELAFKEAIAAKPGLKVVILTGDPTTNAFFVSPAAGGGIGLYALNLGLNIAEPTDPDPANLNIFEAASWEELGKYPADLILYDSRVDPATFADDPIWSSLPAVQAGQVGIWHSTFPYSWQKFNVVLEEMTARIASSEVII